MDLMILKERGSCISNVQTLEVAAQRGAEHRQGQRRLAVVGQAMPTFWFALTLMLWFGITWRLLPITGSVQPGDELLRLDLRRLW